MRVPPPRLAALLVALLALVPAFDGPSRGQDPAFQAKGKKGNKKGFGPKMPDEDKAIAKAAAKAGKAGRDSSGGTGVAPKSADRLFDQLDQDGDGVLTA